MTIDAIVEAGPTAAHAKTLVLRVRYIGARQPFLDPKANQNSSLSGIKPRVLDFFKLVEGNVDGGAKTYLFALDGNVLSDQNASLDSLARGKHELKLDLIERFEQG